MNQTKLLVSKIGLKLKEMEKTLTCAESCTAGGIAYALTDIAGSSSWFERGFVTYSNQAKIDMVAVSAKTLAEQGAVSEAVVAEMALGALKMASADYAIAVSGIAGPDGGSAEKPVGTICFAWATKDKVIKERVYFDGNRQEVREKSIEHSLKGLFTFFESKD